MWFLVPCLALLPAPGGDLRARLGELRAESAAERASAQRWLARHLAESDLGTVREAAIAGDAEVRRRLALALADDDARIGLAVVLAAEKEPRPAEVGRSALFEMIARWCPGWGRPGLSRSQALARLAGKFDRPLRLDPRSQDARLDLALDQLARYAAGAPALVLDPDLALSAHPREPSSGIEGTFDHALDELVRVHRADLEGFALPDAPGFGREGDARRDPGGSSRPWIRVCRAVAGARESAAERVIEWCLGIASDGDPARRSACARALAATGWPGGIAWLERRWLAQKDEAALDGVLLAAGRGQVAPSLALPQVERAMYGLLHSDVESQRRDSSRADGIARAIAAVGPCGPQGEDLSAIAVENLAGLSPREQWLRLVALEGMRSSSRPAAAAVDLLLAARGVPAPVVFQALRARAALLPRAEDAPAIADPPSLLAWADIAGRGGECTRLFLELGVEPPAARETPAGEAARPASLRLAELEWIFFGGKVPAAARRLLLLSNPVERGGLGLEALADRTRVWVRQGARPRFEEAIAAARALDGADAERLDRLEVLSGGGSEELRRRWIEQLSPAARTREDLLCLAALSSAREASGARDALARSLSGTAALADAIAALDRAIEDLRAARREDEERTLVLAVRQLVREATPDLRVRFRVDAWPRRTSPELLRLADLDRALERSGL